MSSALFFLFFFFQAEDGIRDVAVTGVQTCALPISLSAGTKYPGRHLNLPRVFPRKSSPFTLSPANIPNYCVRNGSVTWSILSAPRASRRPSWFFFHRLTDSLLFPSFNTFSNSQKNTPTGRLSWSFPNWWSAVGTNTSCTTSAPGSLNGPSRSVATSAYTPPARPTTSRSRSRNDVKSLQSLDRRARLVSHRAGQEECGRHSNATFQEVNLLNLMLLHEFHVAENPPAQNPELQTH